MSFGLSLSGVRGQGYDGASNMAGRHNGLQAKLLAENSSSLFLLLWAPTKFGRTGLSEVTPRGSSGVSDNERSGSLHKELSQEVG